MAAVPKMPYADCKTQAPGATFVVGGTTYRSAIWGALCPYTDRAARAGTTYNAQTYLGTYLAGIYDITAGAGIGRYFALYVMGGGGLTNQTLNVDELLSATPNRDVPDLCEMDGTIYLCDGGLYGTAPGKEVAPSAALQDDGGVFTNYGTAIGNVTVDDVNLLPATPAVNDAFYFGFTSFPRRLILRVSTAGVGTWTIVWEYWNGSAWTALAGISDGTTGFTVAGRNRITYTTPTDQQATTVNGVAARWIRARVSAFTSITTQPRAAYAFGLIGSTSFTGKCLVIGEDPAVVAPAVRTWGVDSLEDDQHPLLVTASTEAGGAGSGLYSSLTVDVRDHGNSAEIDQVRIYAQAVSTGAATYLGWAGAAFYDSVRNREGKIHTLFQTNVQGKVTLGSKIRVATVALNAVGTVVDTSLTYNQSANAAAVVNAPTDTGPGPTTSDAGQTAKAGMFTTCAVLDNQVWVGGAPQLDTTTTTHRLGFRNYIQVSAIGNGQQFPVTQGFHLAPSDGDELMALRALDGKMVALKRQRIYFLDRAPSVGVVPKARLVASGIGCIARRSAIVVGNYLYFLSDQGLMRLHGNGTVEPIAFSTPVRDWLVPALRDNGQAMHMAACGYDPIRDLLVLSAPAIQQQVTGGANAGNTSGGAPSHNDGCLVVHTRSMQWAAWVGPPYLACFGTGHYHNGTSNLGQALFGADYWGRLYRLSQLTQDFEAYDPTYSTKGDTVASATSTTLVGTAANFPLISSGDLRFANLYVWIVTGTGQGQVRQIVSTTGTQLTVAPAFTTTPAAGDSYRINALYGHADTGDLQLGMPHLAKSLVSVLPHTAVGVPVNGHAAVDVGVFTTEAAAGGVPTMAAGTLGTALPPLAIIPQMARGRVVRLRLAMLEHGNTPRQRVVGAVLGWLLHGAGRAKAPV